MKYIVTGGSGFIGSHLCEALQAIPDSHVYNIDNFNDFYSPQIKVSNTLESCGLRPKKISKLNTLKYEVDSDRYTLIPADIRKLAELPEADIVIHLAGYGGVRPSIENPLLYESNNVQGTMRLLELCRKQGIKKFIFASSSSVYGNGECKESYRCIPISPYAFTKRAMEQISRIYMDIYGIDVIGLRFFTVYGKRQRPDLAIHKFTDLIHKGELIPFYGNGETERDYTYIDDTVKGIIRATEYIWKYTDIYELINLGRHDTVTLNRMVRAIEKALGKRAKKDLLPMQDGDVESTFADIEKAKRLLGYNPEVVFEDGIEKFVQWYLDKKTV